MLDNSSVSDAVGGAMSCLTDGGDNLNLGGVFSYECTDEHGNVLWTDESHNLITTLGKNYLLDTGLAASAVTTVGPFMGLISSVGFSTIVAADTMASHAGWNESQGVTNVPDYTGNRQTAAFSAASAGAKAMSAGLSFVFTSGGTIQGAFMATNTGAVATKNSTAGMLFNAGTLTVAQPVITGNTLTVTWTGTLT